MLRCTSTIALELQFLLRITLLPSMCVALLEFDGAKITQNPVIFLRDTGGKSEFTKLHAV
jgi:hypothetical protein